MDKHDEIKYYMNPDNKSIVQAFNWKKNCDKNNAIMDHPLNNHSSVAKMGQEYNVQKNRISSQIVTVLQLHNYPYYCPVESVLNLLK